MKTFKEINCLSFKSLINVFHAKGAEYTNGQNVEKVVNVKSIVCIWMIMTCCIRSMGADVHMKVDQ